jgi:hypothetical protein
MAISTKTFDVAAAMDRARALTRELMAGTRGVSVEDFLADRRDQERQVHVTSRLPADLADAILADLDKLRAPEGATDDGDTIIS